MRKPCALLIVEGKTEKKFFVQFANELNVNCKIIPYRTNIHLLYRSLKADDFNVNIKDVLLEKAETDEERCTLQQDFAYTYLIYDCEPHHSGKGDLRTVEERCADNLREVKEMLEYFTDETDPTRGKLYINYPMMESIKDCDAFFDEGYAKATVDIASVKAYKDAVAKKRLGNIRVNQWKKDNVFNLMRMNLCKHNLICHDVWTMPTYDSYRTDSDTHLLIDRELRFAVEQHLIQVINTSIFLFLDYFGQALFSELLKPVE